MTMKVLPCTNAMNSRFIMTNVLLDMLGAPHFTHDLFRSADTLEEAWEKAFATDRQAPFGGIELAGQIDEVDEPGADGPEPRQGRFQRGSQLLETADGKRILVINLLGLVHMAPMDCPFAAVDRDARDMFQLYRADFRSTVSMLLVPASAPARSAAWA